MTFITSHPACQYSGWGRYQRRITEVFADARHFRQHLVVFIHGVGLLQLADQVGQRATRHLIDQRVGVGGQHASRRSLADNQANDVRCGDNGIFKGVPVIEEQKMLSKVTRVIFFVSPYDGKYILDGDRLILWQNHASSNVLREK